MPAGCKAKENAVNGQFQQESQKQNSNFGEADTDPIQDVVAEDRQAE